jgi:hypothetical protein
MLAFPDANKKAAPLQDAAPRQAYGRYDGLSKASDRSRVYDAKLIARVKLASRYGHIASGANASIAFDDPQLALCYGLPAQAQLRHA